MKSHNELNPQERRILEDLLSGRLNSPNELSIKFDLMGLTPSADFILAAMSSITSADGHAFNVLCDCLKRDMFLNLFKNRKVMTCIFENYSGSVANFVFGVRVVARAKKMLDIISARRPGFIIHFYLTEEKLFRMNHDMEKAENYVMTLSKHLALVYEGYASKYHRKVLERYDSNWNNQLFMK